MHMMVYMYGTKHSNVTSLLLDPGWYTHCSHKKVQLLPRKNWPKK